MHRVFEIALRGRREIPPPQWGDENFAEEGVGNMRRSDFDHSNLFYNIL